MMKNNTLFTLLTSLVFIINCNAQIELVKDFLKHPTAIDFHDERAFVTIHGLIPNEGKIISFDLENPSETCVTHFENLPGYPRCIAIHENNVYVGFRNFIGIIDLDQQILKLDTLTTSVFRPKCLKIKNDKLYIVEHYKISSINLLEQSPGKTILIDDLNYQPLSIALKDQHVYFTGSNNIFKILIDDVTPNIEEVLLDLETEVYSISIIGNELYFDQTYLLPQKHISKFDLDSPASSIENVVSNIGSAIHINHFDSMLYFVSPTEPNNGQIGKIYKLTEPIINSTKTEKVELIRIYPNPANSVVSIDYPNIGSCEISIYNQFGQLIKKLSGQDRIDIQHLNIGIYLIEVKERGVIRSRSKLVKSAM